MSGAGASTGSSTLTSSPALSRWRLGAAWPSTSTWPASMRRCARALEPSGAARKASSRAPASSGVARRCMARALGDVEQHEDAAGDRDVGHVEGRPPRQLDEVGHGAVADAIDDVAQGAAEQHPGGQPDERVVEGGEEIGHERKQRGAHDARDDGPAAGETAEGDALVADMDELDAREDPVAVADG